mmetsp:Transcript_25368/g.41328  ORF Transcript_25368/g.41328 Transcript_25368/m.41328 type:complete len:482 (-) Transcript_25368:141-1586(-)|eukprot:CAMPEP_0202691838 /NCGR_PEP_ID=MMETSP1385-20130828/6430_1 /ASSEMBLY_ACC=CAM_ASM_000861 /TAXON_ID=933848 /ORGANISM="Elphidium margaritaceum" /LENGTH=481 /DNA_ID=CAMNT_0049347293 /DNA_START=23 /DNA_END=1468 /DNA_ORIENTATION=+
MSGAFNIDIECERTQKQQLKIYCASLTESWDVTRSLATIVQFHAALKSEATIAKNKINLPETLDVNNFTALDEFLSRLGCLAPVLRLSIFHDLLDIPKAVRDGLTYAQTKAFGKVVREGYLQRHLRHVQGGGRKFVRLTKDDRGGSLIIFPDENHLDIIVASLKIGASTELQNLNDKGIDHAFALRSGKRQWILQAADGRNYAMWQSQLVSMLKEFGTVNLNQDLDDDDGNNQEQLPLLGGGASSNKRASAKVTQAQVNQLLQENIALDEKLKKLMKQKTDMKSKIDDFADQEAEMKNAEAEMKRRRHKEVQREKEDLIADYEVKQDNLRGQIEELHRKLEQKTFDEGGKSGLVSLFGEDFIEVDINDYKQGNDGAVSSDNAIDDDDEDEEVGFGGAQQTVTSASSADAYDDDESDGLMNAASGRYKYLHKHMHRHDQKHIHNHRHTHIHDQTVKPPITYTHTHTVCHTIAHTTTQFKIKK